MFASVTRQSDGIVNQATGSFVSDGTPVTISLGFTAQHVVLINETDLVRFERLANQPAANSIKTVAAGTMTLDTTTAIAVAGNTITISAAAAPTGKTFRFIAR